jgi:hypothetical protein
MFYVVLFFFFLDYVFFFFDLYFFFLGFRITGLVHYALKP